MDSGFRLMDSGLRLRDSGFRLQASGFRRQASWRIAHAASGSEALRPHAKSAPRTSLQQIHNTVRERIPSHAISNSNAHMSIEHH